MQQKTQVKVTITFPLGHGKPFSADEADDATIGAVKAAAMGYFEADEDPGSRYYLTHGDAGDELADDTTVGSVAGHAKALKLTLVKELIQG